jgi:hypothetical protein
MICDQCETVAHCTKHGCVPKQPAPVQEPVYHLRQFGDVTKEQLDRYMETGDINPQPAPVQPLRGVFTTYAERFAHAVAVLCGAQPPADMVAEWIANIDVNGEHRLQSWVLSQAATPSWAQGIVVLDAAHVLANDPEEGVGHEDRPPAAQPAVPDAMTSADIQENIEYVAGWNECRQAMLEMTKNRSN